MAAETERERLTALASTFSAEDLMRAFEVLTKAEVDIRARGLSALSPRDGAAALDSPAQAGADHRPDRRRRGIGSAAGRPARSCDAGVRRADGAVTGPAQPRRHVPDVALCSGRGAGPASAAASAVGNGRHGEGRRGASGSGTRARRRRPLQRARNARRWPRPTPARRSPRRVRAT